MRLFNQFSSYSGMTANNHSGSLTGPLRTLMVLVSPVVNQWLSWNDMLHYSHCIQTTSTTMPGLLREVVLSRFRAAPSTFKSWTFNPFIRAASDKMKKLIGEPPPQKLISKSSVMIVRSVQPHACDSHVCFKLSANCKNTDPSKLCRIEYGVSFMRYERVKRYPKCLPFL